MKALVSLAVALTVIPAAAQAAHSAGSPAPAAAGDAGTLAAAVGAPATAGVQHQDALRARVERLARRARSHSARLGLAPPAPARPAPHPDVLARQERRLAGVVGFLSGMKEIARPVDERPAPKPIRAGASLASKIAHQHRRAVRLALRLGLQRPAPLRLAAAPDERAEQLAHWRSVTRWLSARDERVRPHERPLSERIPHHAELACIAEHESHGRWDIDTGNGYYGGLQMDRSFQQAYAPGLYRSKGTADNWTPEEQMRAAERAIRSRGFTPWPNTARICGLL